MSTMLATDALSPQQARQVLSGLFFGFMIATMLFGVVLLESYRYFKSYKHDSICQKLLVALLLGLDALHFSLTIEVAYHYLVKNFGSLNEITHAVWSVKALGSVQIVLIWLVQCLYLIRIWSLTRTMLLHRKIVVPVLLSVILIGMIALGGGLAFIVEVDQIEDILDLASGRFKWVVYLGTGITAAIDVAIAIVMFLILRKSITGIKRTDGVISALIHFFFSTGLLSSLVAVTYIILFAVKPQTLLYLAMTFLTGRLYTISFLELLNLRSQLRKELDATIEPVFSTLRFGKHQSSSKPQPVSTTSIGLGSYDASSHGSSVSSQLEGNGNMQPLLSSDGVGFLVCTRQLENIEV